MPIEVHKHNCMDLLAESPLNQKSDTLLASA